MQSKQDGLVPIGDALSGLGGLVTTEPKTQPIAATFVGLAGTVTVSLTKRGPSWWNRIWRKRRKITKLANLLNSLIKLGEHVWGWAQHFLRVRTASDAHGRVSE